MKTSNKLFQVLVLGGAALTPGCQNESQDGVEGDLDSGTVTEPDSGPRVTTDSGVVAQTDSGGLSADAGAPTVDAGGGVVDAGGGEDAGGHPSCFCPTETECVDSNGCALPGFVCCWGDPEGC